MNKSKLAQLFADVLFPEGNACHICERFPEPNDILCFECRHSLNKLRLGRLGAASREPHPPLKVCLAAWPHKGEARELVHLLKYSADGSAAHILGEGMAAALLTSAVRPEEINAVVPVPLHAERLKQRGYNQALLLAQAVCDHTQLPLMEHALIRLYATDTQTHRDRMERLKAMEHAFAVPDVKAVKNLHILLVDDVLTTGATAMSCAIALMDAGAASVSLLTACRA